ncbi:MAG: flagellar hook-basal body complex protein FliE [Acidobacteriota bacterium]|jgi:flagellar hook-basal body complex protein FliE|nr:MAG: flagellar hook-basal body complex protein FliE [Acidobacteriota bacterium]
MAINGLPSISNATGAAAGTGSAAGAKSPQETGFAEALGELIRTVDGATGEANVAINRMLDGTGDVHEAMIAMQRAEQMLELTVQVRNKLVQAYQEVMRMSV